MECDFFDQRGFDVVPGIARGKFPVLDQGVGFQFVQSVYNTVVIKSQLNGYRFLLLSRPLVWLHVLFNHVADPSFEIEDIVVVDPRRLHIVKRFIARERCSVLDSGGVDLEWRRFLFSFYLLLARGSGRA